LTYAWRDVDRIAKIPQENREDADEEKREAYKEARGRNDYV
jgi:hypothetical protein